MIAMARTARSSAPRRRAAGARWRVCLLGALLAVSAASVGDAVEPPAPAAPASAQPACATPESCFARMVAAQRDVAGIRARFRQTKHVALLDDPLVSEGRFSFDRPERVRWEMEKPEPLVVEVSGGELRAGPPGEVARVEAGPAVGLFRDLAGIFTGAGDYAGSRFALGPGPEREESFVLTPRDPSLARVIATIAIELDPASGGPRRVTIAEAGGDRTEIELFDVTVERAGGAGPPS